MKIGILHYSAWPVIGGVETVIRQHAQLLSRHGHEVSIFSGEGAAFSKQIPSIVFRELNTRDPLVKAAQQEALAGIQDVRILACSKDCKICSDPFSRSLSG